MEYFLIQRKVHRLSKDRKTESSRVGVVSKTTWQKCHPSARMPNKAYDIVKRTICALDEDYFAQKIFNCDLVNLEDILQNGTVINGTLVEKPHSFSTACNIATQVMAQCASNQYGGQTETLSHLAPFVDISRQKLRKEVNAEFDEMVKNDEIDKKTT